MMRHKKTAYWGLLGCALAISSNAYSIEVSIIPTTVHPADSMSAHDLEEVVGEAQRAYISGNKAVFERGNELEGCVNISSGLLN